MKISLTIWLLSFYLVTIAQTAIPPIAGNGSLDTPYQISSAENLYWISQNNTVWDKHYIQTEHIDLSGYENLIWIGNSDGFSGSYNGQGFSISNFVLQLPDEFYVGLFGKIIGSDNLNPAVLKNMVIVNANVNGQEHVGGLAGYTSTAEVFNCKTSGSVSGESHIGGLIGYSIETTGSVIISYCSSSCMVSGDAFNKGEFVGGLVGRNLHYAETFKIANSYATGIVSGIGSVGGLIGASDEGVILNSYSRGNVTRTSGSNITFGSFIGYANESDIQNSYSTGQVIYDNSTNPTDKGFAGYEANGPVYSANFFDNETSLQTSATGATGKSTAEMKTKQTFTDAGWDFEGETVNGSENFWDLIAEENDGYPYLLPGDDYVSPQAPNALSFDGVNDYVSFSPNGSGGIFDGNTINSSFTMELWFKVTNYANFSNIISKHSNSGSRAGYFIENNGAGSIRAGIANSSNGWTVLNGTDAINENQWHHTAFTYDTATTTIELYIDGILQSSESGFTPVFNYISNFRLASSHYYNTYSQIEIDEFRVWDTVLSNCEIQKNMKTELSLPRENLIAYYRFNEGEPSGNNSGITTLPNLVSEADYTGSLNNFALSGSLSNWVSSGADIHGNDEYYDNTPPTITSTHANVTLTLDNNCEAILPDYKPDITFTDNCDDNPVITQQPEAGTAISDTTIVTLTVTDYGNNSDQIAFTAAVSDNFAPVITTVINDTLLEAVAYCKAVIPDFSNQIEATDNCSIEDLTVEQTPLPGTEISGSGNLITLTVSDLYGNTDQTSFLVAVTDTTLPQITSIHNDTIVIIENCQAFLPDYTSLVEAVDNCSSTFNIVQNPAPGTEIFGTENPINIQVSDDEGNTSEISFNATVRDIIVPEITCPQNFAIQIAKDETFYQIQNDTLNYLTANDNCDITSIYNDFNLSDDLTGAQIPVGNNLISWYAEDEFGNIGVCRVSATVYNQWNYFKLERNQELNHPDGLAFNQNAGKNTAISGNWAIAGLGWDSGMGEDAGAATIYHKENGEWIFKVKLYGSTINDYDNFGYAVALTDTFAFVSAPYNDVAGTNCGAVYVFKNENNTWAQAEVLTAEIPLEDSRFGSAVDVWGEKLIVGAEGKNKAYIFEYSEGQWQQTAELSSDDHSILASFGNAVAIYENTAVVGASSDFTHGNYAGSAFVFENESDIWQQKAKLISSNIGAYDEFGGSVDIYENDIVIGAEKNSENGNYAGMAYIFVKPETNWTDTIETATLQPSDPVANDIFACDVAIYNGRVLIGSSLSDPVGMSSGSLYIFDKPLTGWNNMTQTQKIIPENNGVGMYFGNSVNISGSFGIASAPGAVSNLGNTGAMFVFSMVKPQFFDQPQDVENICAGTDTIIHITAELYDTISWEISYDNGETFTPIGEGDAFTGYNTPTLSFTTSESIDSTLYRCQVTNYVHTIISDTVLFTLDTEPPIIENIETQTLIANENCQAVLPDYTEQITIYDNCGLGLEIIQTPVPGSLISGSATSVIITATDSNANTNYVEFNVQLQDNTPPVPEIASLDNITNECSVTITETPTATDNCNGVITGTTSDPLTYSESGIYTIIWSYNDGNGNISTQEQIVTVEDLADPIPDAANLDDITAECEVTTLAAPTALDNCAGAITGTTTDPLTYAEQGSYIVTWSYDDGNGNIATQEQTVIIDDITDPTVSCIENQSIDLNEGETFYTVQGAEFDPNETTDNCELASIENDFNNSATLAGEELPEGTNTIVWTVTDIAGNTNSCQFDVVVNPYVGMSNLSANGITVYPNPTTGKITICPVNSNIAKMVISDITGKKLIEKSTIKQKVTIDLYNYENGLYILTLHTNNQTFITKIIKE